LGWWRNAFYLDRLAQHNIAEAFGVDTEALTFRADDPDRKLDHIFYNQNYLELNEAQNYPLDTSLPSDHLPLMARFRFK